MVMVGHWSVANLGCVNFTNRLFKDKERLGRRDDREPRSCDLGLVCLELLKAVKSV